MKINRTWSPGGIWACLAVGLLLPGCIKAPDVVIVDRYTALEVQAAGNYEPLEDELVKDGISVGPETYTSDQIVSDDGEMTGGLSEAYRGIQSRADRIDALRRRNCVGEAWGGLLVLTPDTCKGRVDEQDVANLLERENRNRRQIWRYMGQIRPDSTLEEIRSSWRVDYLKTVPCDSAVQDENEQWERVVCAE